MARFACILGGLILIVFAILGELLFRTLGITVPAFQTAGGLLLFLIALDMVFGKQISPATISPEEKIVATQKEDIAITPLAVPMIAGPGGISTVILLQSKADGFWQYLFLNLALLLVVIASYIIFRFAAYGGRWLNPLMLRVAKRLMGLLLTAVAVQFVFNGLAASKLFQGTALNLP